jgi:hypothetical protein
MPLGGSMETRSATAYTQQLTLDVSIDDFSDVDFREELRLRLADLYMVDESLITLERSAAGSLVVIVTIATASRLAAVDLNTIRRAMDEFRLSASIDSVLNTTINVTDVQPPHEIEVEYTAEIICPRGQW